MSTKFFQQLELSWIILDHSSRSSTYSTSSTARQLTPAPCLPPNLSSAALMFSSSATRGLTCLPSGILWPVTPSPNPSAICTTSPSHTQLVRLSTLLLLSSLLNHPTTPHFTSASTASSSKAWSFPILLPTPSPMFPSTQFCSSFQQNTLALFYTYALKFFIDAICFDHDLHHFSCFATPCTYLAKTTHTPCSQKYCFRCTYIYITCTDFT